MTLSGAIMQLVELSEHPIMPVIFRPAIQKVIETISELEENPEPHWIPVTERLPEDVEEGQEYPTVIYSTNSGEVAAGWYETLTRTWWRESISDDVIKDKVIAWMPLPEPYKVVTE